MGGALETFCGQAYGAGQYQMLSVHMQRAMLVLTLTSVPIADLGLHSSNFLLLRSRPGFFGSGRSVRSVADSQHLALRPSPVPTKVSASPEQHSSIDHKHWSFQFDPCYNVLDPAVYIKFSAACEKTWTGFSKEGMNNLLEFLSLSIPSGLMVCQLALQLVPYVTAFLISLPYCNFSGLPNPIWAGSAVRLSVIFLKLPHTTAKKCGVNVFMRDENSTVIASQWIKSTRVSNELGAGRARAARLAVRVVILLAVTGGLLVALISVAARDYWGFLFTNEEEVVKYFASVVPILATSGFMDGIQGVLSGVARGCGWQKLGTLVNLGAYYLVGLPRAITLGLLVHLGGKGLWMGIISGSGLQALLLLAISVHTDWGKEVNCIYPPDLVGNEGKG
ncbi:unnamed protein product [Thlaspi arvense]|uniref:Protein DETOXIFICATION n=1 Tax=Thlaspi arvense TaxID=13288 RepID=A0AAU9SUU6_THLAR|nr:unnamed protein product [Thlaspi arvense]